MVFWKNPHITGFHPQQIPWTTKVLITAQLIPHHLSFVSISCHPFFHKGGTHPQSWTAGSPEKWWELQLQVRLVWPFPGLDFPCEQLQGCSAACWSLHPKKTSTKPNGLVFRVPTPHGKFRCIDLWTPQIFWAVVLDEGFWTHEKRRRSQPAQPLLKKDPFQDPAVYTPDTSNQNTGCCNYHRLSLQSWVMPYYNWGDER